MAESSLKQVLKKLGKEDADIVRNALDEKESMYECMREEEQRKNRELRERNNQGNT